MQNKKQSSRRFWAVGMVMLCFLFLSACLAPEDLDYTPSPPPATSTPEPQAQIQATPGNTQEREKLDALLASIPDSVNAGTILWQRTDAPPIYKDESGGTTGKLAFSERGGGSAEFTFGVFDTPESATAYYELIKGRLRNLENSDEREGYPTPNAFGSGYNGWDAMFLAETTYIRIAILFVSSTVGDPLTPLTNAVLTILREAGHIEANQ